jgi:hypothetical protein
MPMATITLRMAFVHSGIIGDGNGVISLCQLLWFNSLFLVAIKVQPNLLLDE